MNKIVAIIACGLSILLVVIAPLSLSSSLWFMSGFLPDASVEMIIGARHHRDFDAIRSASERLLLNHEDQAATVYFSRYVTGIQAKGTVLVGLPTLRYQFTARERLKQSGWQVERIGWLLRAQRGDNQQPGKNALQQAGRAVQFLFRHVAKQEQPFQPLALVAVQAKSLPLFDRDYVAVISLNKDTISVKAAFDTYSWDSVPAGGIRATSAGLGSEQLFVLIPGKMFGRIPDKIFEETEARWLEDFGFRKTKPPLLSEFITQPQLFLRRSTREIAFGIEGDSQLFMKRIKEWFGKEVARDDPVRRAFNLPDGTVGFEYVAGKPVQPFTSSKSREGCEVATIRARQTWLCRAADFVILSSPDPVENDQMEVSDDGWWRINVPSQLLTSAVFSHISRVEAEGSDTYLKASLYIKR